MNDVLNKAGKRRGVWQRHNNTGGELRNPMLAGTYKALGCGTFGWSYSSMSKTGYEETNAHPTTHDAAPRVETTGAGFVVHECGKIPEF